MDTECYRECDRRLREDRIRKSHIFFSDFPEGSTRDQLSCLFDIFRITRTVGRRDGRETVAIAPRIVVPESSFFSSISRVHTHF